MAQKSFREETSVAAGVTTNILANADIEFLTQPSLVTFFMGQSATGFEATIKADSNDLIDRASPNVVAAAGRLIDPDDKVVDQILLPAGTRLKVLADNTTGGALTFSLLVIVEEIPPGMLG